MLCQHLKFTTNFQFIPLKFGVMEEMKNRIVAALDYADINQAELARRLRISPNAVSAWVTGRNLPDTKHILNICRETGVRLDWLAFDKGPMVSKQIAGDTIIPYEASIPDDHRELLAAYAKLKRAHQAAVVEFLNRLVS